MRLIAIVVEHRNGDECRQNIAILIGDYTSKPKWQPVKVHVLKSSMSYCHSRDPVSPVWKYFGFPAENSMF